MTLDGLLTLLALLVAIWALIPKATRLLVSIGIKSQIPIAFIAFLIILYVQFDGQEVNLLFAGKFFSLKAPQLSFLIVCAWALTAYIVYKIFSRPGAYLSLPTISKLVDNLIYEQRFSELIDVVEPRLPTIEQAANRSLFAQKLHDKIRSLSEDEHQESLRCFGKRYTSKPVKPPSEFVKRTRQTVGKLAVVIPAHRRTQEVAGIIIRALCQSNNLRNYVIKVRPYFALPLLRLSGANRFSDAYFRGLLLDSNSILYQELKSESNFSPGIQPHREGSRLLKFLFKNASVAEKLGVWKPIGSCMIELLRPHESPDSEFIKTLNKKPHSRRDERWGSPIYTGIYFFNVMVTAAARQGIRYHMWLYYFTHIVAELEKIYDTSDPDVNESDEFPIESARLINELIGVLSNWILLVEKLPSDSPHLNSTVFDKQQELLVYNNQSYDNANIPVSAANALGMCLSKILLSQKINLQFKSYIYDITIKTLDELSKNHWRQLLIHCIVNGSPAYSGREGLKKEYGQVLKNLSSEVDLLLWQQVSDLDDKIKQIYG